MSKTVVIVGAGICGVLTAKRLAKDVPSSVKIVLINPTEYTLVLPSVVRLMFHKDPSKVSIPIEKIIDAELKSGKIELVIDSVTHFDDSVVAVKSGAQYNYDALVLATGAKWPTPIDASEYIGTKQSGIKQGIEKTAAEFDKAKSVAIIGGGDNGVELLGEFLHYAPEKEYHIIHSRDSLMTSRFTQKVRQGAAKQLNELAAASGAKVHFHFNSYGHKKSDHDVVIENNKTGKQEAINVDLIYSTIGPKANVPPTTIKSSNFLDDAGYVKIKQGFQTEYSKKIFAIGDVTNLPYKGLVVKDKWIASLLNNIKYSLGLSNTYDSYVLPSTDDIPSALSIGPTGGVGQIKIPLLGVCAFPKFLVVRVKAANLFSENNFAKLLV